MRLIYQEWTAVWNTYPICFCGLDLTDTVMVGNIAEKVFTVEPCDSDLISM